MPSVPRWLPLVIGAALAPVLLLLAFVAMLLCGEPVIDALR